MPVWCDKLAQERSSKNASVSSQYLMKNCKRRCAKRCSLDNIMGPPPGVLERGAAAGAGLRPVPGTGLLKRGARAGLLRRGLLDGLLALGAAGKAGPRPRP